MPSVQKGEKQNHYMKRCVPVVLKELGENTTKTRAHAVAKCLGMFREKYQEKAKSNASLTEEEFWSDFSWENCDICKSLENDVNHSYGIYELDIPNKRF